MSDADKIYADTKEAVLKELEERNYGTTSEDIEAYTGVAVGTAAAGVCAVYATPAASPICYAVGEYIGELGGEYVVKAWNKLFADDEEFKAYQKRQAEKAEKAIHETAIKSIELIYWNQWHDSMYKLMVMHHELWPKKNYTYINAVNDILKVSKEIDKPVEKDSSTFILSNVAGNKIKIKLIAPDKRSPYFGLLPRAYWAVYFNTFQQFEFLKDSEETVFNIIFNHAKTQLDNLQKSTAATLALFIAGFEVDMATTPEAKAILA